MSEKISFATSQIPEGLNEALQDLQSIPVEGLKKTEIHKPTVQTNKNHPLTDALTGIVPKDVDFDTAREKILREQLCLNEEPRQSVGEIAQGVDLSHAFYSTKH
ncbi:MAG: hypothetical protein J6N22_03820 [Schwartzia sp.]|nr:hypothetical protein [Schwartzia sp. (in: firmicutes)]